MFISHREKLNVIGVFPPPPAAAQLMQILPPPWCFNGPFVSVDLLIESLSKFAQAGRKFSFLIRIYTMLVLSVCMSGIVCNACLSCDFKLRNGTATTMKLIGSGLRDHRLCVCNVILWF